MLLTDTKDYLAFHCRSLVFIESMYNNVEMLEKESLGEMVEKRIK